MFDDIHTFLACFAPQAAVPYTPIVTSPQRVHLIGPLLKLSFQISGTFCQFFRIYSVLKGFNEIINHYDQICEAEPGC